MSIKALERVVLCPCPPLLLTGAGGRVPDERLTAVRHVASDTVQWLADGADQVLLITQATSARRESPLLLQDISGTSMAFGFAAPYSLGSGQGRTADVPVGVLVGAALLGEYASRTRALVAGSDLRAADGLIRDSGAARVLVMGEESLMQIIPQAQGLRSSVEWDDAALGARYLIKRWQQ